MKLRLMKKEDIPFVFETGEKERFFKFSKTISGFWNKSQLEKWIKSKNDVLVIVEENSKIIGYILSSLHKATGKATLENIWVDSNFRKKGIAQKMIKFVVRKLKNNGATYICGMIKENNKKILNLFEKIKFNKGFKFYWMSKRI